MKAVLFDIDGTILNCNKAGRISLIEATKEVFGTIGKMETVDFQGKTDPLILHESLLHMGFNEEMISQKTDKLKDSYFSHLRDNIFKRESILMPGIEEIIKNLHQNQNIRLGLLTGNFHQSARIKLDRFDLNKYFDFGVFGDDASIRNYMPGIAQKIISEKYNDTIGFKNIFIIGDTKYDIRCAKYSGSVSIAVGTGWSEKDILLAENPDYYFNDLNDVSSLLDIIHNH